MTDSIPESKRNWGYRDGHALLEEKITPTSFNVMRAELMKHPDLCEEANRDGQTFEDCIGIIAARLNIALDGLYDPEQLFSMLADALRNRGRFETNPENSAKGLVRAELHEKDKDVTLVEVDKDEVPIIAPALKKGVFIICDACKTSYDCASNKTCGSPTKH